MLRKTLALAFLFFVATAAVADDTTEILMARVWPATSEVRVSELGRGIGLVFTPDLSVPGNCRFYESLGFACFEGADWDRVLGDIRSYNIFHPERVVRTLVLETHGTNGNGLKLQTSYAPSADRSYISVGALQERLEPDGVEYIIISACNSGRLLRPSIYNTIDRNNGDRLFLPATRGIVDASPDFNASHSGITIITPATSHIETSLAASVRELAPVTRRLLEKAARQRGIAPPQQFAISDMLMQIILRHPLLALSTTGYVEALSGEVQPENVSEGLFRSFKSRLNALAAREVPTLSTTTTKVSSIKRHTAAKQTSAKKTSHTTKPAAVQTRAPAGTE
jgi:hypothetical protein